MTIGLLHAVRKVIVCDSDPVRREVFDRLRRTRTAVRLAYAVHRMGGKSWIASALVAGYGAMGLLRVRVPPAGDVIAVASQENARRRLRQLGTLLDDGELTHVRLGIGAAPARAATDLARAMRSPRRMKRYLRIVYRINRRHDFLVSCRVAGLLGCYPVAMAHLGRRRPRAVVVSSDSNPEEIAFTTAARTLGIATIFASHAYPTSVSPPLDFDLSIIEGEAALNVYRRLGPLRGTVCFAGVDGESIPIDPARVSRLRPAIGIFAPKVVNWTTFARLIEEARSGFGARQVVIRWHPSAIERPQLAQVIGDTSIVIETHPGDTLRSVVDRCDWVVADADSNVHLEVLKLGVPTVALAELGTVPPERSDLYGFVSNRVIPAPFTSLRAIDPERLRVFFGSDWPDRFRRFDAAYLRAPAAVAAEVRESLRAVMARQK
jgi:hypothetical protein